MGDFLPKCAFFYEIWVENRSKIALFVLWANLFVFYTPLFCARQSQIHLDCTRLSKRFGEEQQVFAGFIDVEGEDVVAVGGFAAETSAEFFAGHPDSSGCDFGFGMAFAEFLKLLAGHFGDVEDAEQLAGVFQTAAAAEMFPVRC